MWTAALAIAVTAVALVVVATLAIRIGGHPAPVSGSDAEPDVTSAAYAQDEAAKDRAVKAWSVVERYGADHDGNFAGITPSAIARTNPALARTHFGVTAGPDTFTISVTSVSGAEFVIQRPPGGTTRNVCLPPGTGTCPLDGTW